MATVCLGIAVGMITLTGGFALAVFGDFSPKVPDPNVMADVLDDVIAAPYVAVRHIRRHCRTGGVWPVDMGGGSWAQGELNAI